MNCKLTRYFDLSGGKVKVTKAKYLPFEKRH